MFKKRNLRFHWNNMLRFTLLSLLATGFVITVGFTEKRHQEMLCMELIIAIQNNSSHEFIDKGDVEQLLRDKFGSLIGKPIHAINISLLENIICNDPFVSRAEVFSTIDGKLNIELIPRDPIVRIIDLSGESYYIDQEGVIMPLSEKYSASVPVASGFISAMKTMQRVRTRTAIGSHDTSFHPLTIEKVYMLADYLKHHEFWNSQIQQVYVHEEGDMELVPRVGNHHILFGDLSAGQAGVEEMDEKFNRLLLFYQQGLSKLGWNNYSLINLKYKDQIVCTKTTTNGK